MTKLRQINKLTRRGVCRYAKLRHVGKKLGGKLGEELGEKLTKNQINIIEAIQRNNKITQLELADAIGISTTT